MITTSRFAGAITRLAGFLVAAVVLSACGGGGASNLGNPGNPGGGGGPPQPGSDASLDSLAIAPGTLSPLFDSQVVTYTANVASDVASIGVTATPGDAAATMSFNGTPLSAGAPGATVALVAGTNRLALLVTAEDGTTTRTYTVDVTREAPPVAASDVTLQLLVLDTGGAPVEGALARADGRDGSSTTDEDGRTTIVTPASDGVVLRLSRSGFVDQMVRVDLADGADASTPLRVGMVPRAAVQRFAADQAVTLSGADGLRVALPAHAFVDEDGNPVSGEIDAYLTPLDISTDAGLGAFPGGYAAIGPAEASGSLVTLGVADFTFEQGGQRLQLAPGVTASIDVPIYVTQNLDGSTWQVNDPVPLWRLDEADAVWRFEGDGLVVASPGSPAGRALRGDAGHFSWWNADLFVSGMGASSSTSGVYESFLEPRLHCDEIGGSCDAILAGQEGAWVQATILGINGPRRSMSRWVPFDPEAAVDPISIPTQVDIGVDAAAGDGYYAIASVTPSPVRSTTAGELIVADVLLQPRHQVNGGLFAPGERLRGYMAVLDEVHTYRFEGRAGRVFRLRGYPAANIDSGPGISSDLGATVRLFRGDDLLAEASFDATGAAEIEVDLPANGEYRVTFTADGKVPGYYVATTAMVFRAASAGGNVAFPAYSASHGTGLYVIGDDGSSYVRLSPAGSSTTCLGPSTASGTCRGGSTAPLSMRGDIQMPGWLPGDFQQLRTGEVVYLSSHDRPGFADLFVLDPAAPELATRLSGAEIAGVDGLQVVGFRTASERPGRIVYKVLPVGPDSNAVLGALYVVESANPETTRRAIPLFEGRDSQRYELSADGRWVVYVSRSPDTGTITGDLYAVDLDAPASAPVPVNPPLDYANGEQMGSFAISPDSRHVVFSVVERVDASTTRRQVYLADLLAPDSPPRRLSLTTHTRTMEVRFAPDGSQVIYRHAGTSNLQQGGALYVVDLTNPANPGAPVNLNAQIGLSSGSWQVSPAGDRVIQMLTGSVHGLSLSNPGAAAVELLRLPATLRLRDWPVFTGNGDGMLLRTQNADPGNWPFGLIHQRIGDAVDGYRTLLDGAEFDLDTSSGVRQVAVSPDGTQAIVLIGTSSASGQPQILSVPISGETQPVELVPFEDAAAGLRLRIVDFESERRYQFLMLQR